MSTPARTLTAGGNAVIMASTVRLTAQWGQVDGRGLDASLYMLTAAGKVRSDADMVFYNQPEGAGGAVRLISSDGAGATFEVDLSRVPGEIDRLVLCVTADAGSPHPVGRHPDLGFRLTDSSGQGLVDYRPDLGGGREAALRLAELYRRDGWKIRAVGQGFEGGLAPLARAFGVDVAEPAAAPSPPPPPPPAPTPPVSLSKISLDKGRPTVSLDKRAEGFGEIRINLNWTRGGGKRGFFGGGGGIDLDLGCLFEMRDGRKGVVQALGDDFGAYGHPPFVELSGDDRTGDVASGETLRVNGARWSEIRRLAIYAFIYQGAPNWAATDGVLTLETPGQPPIEVRMTEGRNDRGFCGVALIENDRDGIRVTRLVEYFRGHSDFDRRVGWGLRWVAGSKD